MDHQLTRKQWLVSWAGNVDRAASNGLFGRQIILRQAILINGPRAGAIELYAGFDSGTLLRSLSSDDSAILRQLIPFAFSGEPVAFMSGRCVRIEAGWPSDVAENNITLSSLGQHPTNGGRWLVGKNERGNVLTAGLSDNTPHWLISGTTGSGKTTAIISLVAQLARDKENRLVLIDAKHGASLRQVASVRGLVGPLAIDVMTARAALTWCVDEMAARYAGGQDTRRLIVVIDEMQELTGDPLSVECVRKLVAQGRGARVYVIMATQHPVVASLGGPTIGRNLVGRLALRVADASASQVAVGSANPRADHLLGQGDSYAITPSATHRTQIARLDMDVLTAQPDLAEWPEVESELPADIGEFSGDEIGCSIVAAEQRAGRPTLIKMLGNYGLGRPGTERAVRLLNLGRDAHSWLLANSWSLAH